MKSTNRNKYAIVALIGLITFASIAAISPKEMQPRERNLKVLPKDISHDSLDHLMDYYKVALNVKCGYCHTRSEKNPKKLDMAADGNPIKEVTRKMILMTNEMNDKYIHSITHPSSDATQLQLVTCNTCHRGKAKPDVAAISLKED